MGMKVERKLKSCSFQPRHPPWQQHTTLDLDSQGTQIIELGSAVWLEDPIRTGRSEVYIWGTEHAVKLCMGPTFALHEYTISRGARNYAIPSVAMFTIHGKPNGMVMEQGKSVNTETCKLTPKQIAFEMVRAVQGRHSVGMIHGDIKLSNFLVCSDGRVRLCDFGTSEYECDCMSHSEMSVPLSVAWGSQKGTSFGAERGVVYVDIVFTSFTPVTLPKMRVTLIWKG